MDNIETAITEIRKTQFSSRSDACNKDETSMTSVDVTRLISISYTYFRSYREFVDIPGEHRATGEYTGVRRGHHCRRDRAETFSEINAVK